MDKIAFQLGPLTIHWYGVLVALGFLAGLWTASRRARLVGLSPDTILDLGPWLILGTLVGARGLYVLSYWREEFAADPFPEIFMVHRGGLVFYGGLIGASLTVLVYLLVKKLPVWTVGDTVAPSIALGSFFGRLGCLMNGCCFGRACDLPWAIKFPADHATHGLPVHPSQVYDSLLNLLLYLGLAWWFRHRKFPGQIFAGFLMGYAICRGIVEWFRGDYPVRYVQGWLTPAQLISIAILVTGMTIYLILVARQKKPT